MNPTRLLRLWRTTAFRTSLYYAVVYSLLSALALGFSYWSTASHVESQIDERLQLETQLLIQRYRDRALPALLETIRQRDDDRRSIFFYLLLGPDSRHLAGHIPAWPEEMNGTFATLQLQDVFPATRVRSAGGDRVRLLATTLPGNYRLLVGRDLNQEERLLTHTLNVLLLVTGFIFIFTLCGNALLGYHTLRRVDAINRTAGEIMAGDLSRRIAVGGRDDEFDQLGQKLNAMLERIEQLMAGLRQVTDNIAHDLRSPLNRLRNRLEFTLREIRDDEQYRAALQQTIDDADELLKTFNALLSIAQAEAGVQRCEWSPVDLAALTEDLAELYEALAEEQGIRLTYTVSAAATVRGNRQLLAQAISNLLDNAVKYTPSGGQITLTLDRIAGASVITVADSGPGIPADQYQQVLKRFVRLDSARTTPGNGLGLSLVNAVAKLHGAVLTLSDNQPGLKVAIHFSSGGNRQVSSSA